MRKEIVIAVAGIAAVVGTSIATNKIMNRPAPPQVASQPSKPLADDNYRKKIITAYIDSQNLSARMQQTELNLCISDKNCSAIRSQLQASVGETNRLADETQKTLKLKPGTSFNVNVDRGEVTYSEPK